MSTAGAYHARRGDPDFARLWARAVARAGEARAARLGEAAARRDGMFGGYRRRRDGWTEVRVRIFLRGLSETGCVRDACQRARISSTSAYRMRQRDAKFAGAWAKALDRALPTLEQAAWERAVMGWDEVVWKDGVEVSRKRRFSDGLLRFLINHAGGGQPRRKLSEKELIGQARAAAYAAGGYFDLRATSEETDAAIMRKLDAIDRARAREAAEEAEKAAAKAAALEDRFDGEEEDWDEDGDGEAGADAPAEWVPKVFGQPRITGM